MRMSAWSSDVCSSDLVASVNVLHVGDRGGSTGGDVGHFGRLFGVLTGDEDEAGIARIDPPPPNAPRDRPMRKPSGDASSPRTVAALQLAVPAESRIRTEERRGGKEWVSTCRSRGGAVN